ncbi:MAG TPA: DASS family sodium-coupled anion symporter [Thermoanaerobaculia bacterium]|nr:DASS family sodium-coupled anion symporter [Thermoanaerobaculia bacterium]
MPDPSTPPSAPLRLGQLAGLLAGLLAAAAILLFDSPLQHFGEHGARPARAAAVVACMAVWWLTEAVPIYWTACLPLLAFPLLRPFAGGTGANLKAAILPYVDPYIFLFAGGMAIAAAMQQHDLHRRIALSIMVRVGAEPRRLLAGVLLATAFVSLWISNTATATMMFPIGVALIAQLERQQGRRLAHYGMAIMLAVAYGSNVGGIGTKIGTAPNAQLAGFAERMGIEISFLQFAAVGLPFVVMFLPVVWLALWRVGRRERLHGDLGSGVLAGELAALGRVTPPERVIGAVFLTAAGLWIASKPLTALLQTRWSGLTSAHVEGGIAMLAAVALLFWRSGGGAVLRPASLRTVPWETLLLLGGGFAMAAAVQQSGLSAWLAERLLVARALPAFEQMLLASVVTVAVSAIASNTATVAIMLVVLREAVAAPLLPTILFAATLAASCDFALPAGTPPNAIVFGSGYVSLPRMARTGVVLDLLAALLVAGWCWLIVPLVMG